MTSYNIKRVYPSCRVIHCLQQKTKDCIVHLNLKLCELIDLHDRDVTINRFHDFEHYMLRYLSNCLLKTILSVTRIITTSITVPWMLHVRFTIYMTEILT